MANSAEQQHNSKIDQEHIVLVVEDEIVVRSVVSAYLRDSGFSVIEAANANEALAILGSGTTVDIVFTDIEMPGDMNGIALTRWLSQHHKDIPVLVTSGNKNLSGDISERFFLLKPYLFEILEDRVRDLLRDR